MGISAIHDLILFISGQGSAFHSQFYIVGSIM
ncbi:unnamed protein product [Callosobruchus maculatus]|uniref:Uncharacterized protein n=1 Tax=Callosobruchus maculatus TaxID=64391 RepID=A0A653C378_CALMS|nr:unnamed protein product [Callosobruchus maculatus]